MRRHHALLSAAAVGVAAMLLGACSTAQPDAITVNGDGIPRDEFEQRLEDYAANDAYVAQQSAQNITVVGEGSSAVSTAFARGELESSVLYLIAGQEVDARGLTVDDDTRAFAQYLVDSTFAETSSGFSDEFMQERVDETADVVALAVNLAGEESLAAAEQALLDADEAAGNVRFGARCVSHILSADDAGAQAVLAELESGAAFGDVAVARSTDPSAATNKGELGCFGIEDQTLDPDFLAGVFDAEVGVPSTVTTQFGTHVVLVTSIEPRTAEEAMPVVVNDVLQKIGPPLSEFIAEARKDATVDVDSRYGRWDDEQGLIVDGEAGAPPTSSTSTTVLPAG